MFRKQLASLSALVAFEAAARLLSFTLAANELNVTQAAVSRQIRLLETRLGVRLFHRGHRRISLTAEGEALSEVMTQSLRTISATLIRLHGGKDTELVISALVAFSNLWLAPRLLKFQQAHPEMNIRVIAANEYENLATSEIQVALRFGYGDWPDGEATFLFQDRVYPVASPEYVSSHPPVERGVDIIGHHLNDSNVKYAGWLGWNEWLRAIGYEGPEAKIGTWYSYYNDAVSAALNGHGITLGWNALVREHLESGRLVRLSSDEVLTDAAHYAVATPSARSRPSVRAFIDWIQSETSG